MLSRNPSVILYDANGNPAGIILDGSIYRLQTQAKLIDTAGSYINPAKEDTLSSIKDTDGIKKVAIPTPNATDTTGTITTLNGTVSMAMQGYPGIALVITGTWSATLVFEVSSDGGSTWTTSAFATPAGSYTIPIPQVLSSTTSNGTYRGLGTPTSTHVRVRASAFTSGTVSVRIVAASTDLQQHFNISGILQDVIVSIGNSSTANLNVGATFPGTSETTLGVAGIQINLKTDQNCTVHCYQSPEGTNWDIDDSYTTTAGTGDSRTIQATASYYKVTVTNNGASPTTYLRLQTALCPTVEALPRSLGAKTLDRSLSVAIATDQINTDRVEGRYGVGTANSPYPLILGGRYSVDGTLKYLAIDSQGRILTSSVRTNAIPIELNYDQSVVIAGAQAGLWHKGFYYTIPTSYQLNMEAFLGYSADNRITVRVSKFLVLGTYNIGTQTFAAGASYTSPCFASYLEAELTTGTGNTNDIILTATYVNQGGVGGRTATSALIKKNTPAGFKTPFTLQGDDYGVLSVTNVSRDKIEVGAVNLNGGIEFWWSRLATADLAYSMTPSRDSMIAFAGEVVALDFSSNAAATVERIIKVVGALEPA